MKRFQTIALISTTAAMILFSGCAETGAEKGALLGAGGGALVGQAIGHNTTSTVVGAALGGIAGAAIGDSQDNKRKYYRDQYGHTYYIGNDGRAHYIN